VIEYSNAIATSFLSLFGIEEGNGLSTFVTSIAKPLDLKGLIPQFFKPPKQDNRGRGAVMTGNTANIDANNNTPDELDDNNDEVNNNSKDKDINAMDTATALLPELIALHVSFINECTSESVADHVSNNDNDSIRDEDKHECAVSPDTNDGANHRNDSSNGLEQCMELMNCNKLDAVSSLALNLIQLLEFGKMSSRSINSQSKYMSRNQRWFKAKEGGGTVMQQWRGKMEM
jgi:hypothetical protein